MGLEAVRDAGDRSSEERRCPVRHLPLVPVAECCSALLGETGLPLLIGKVQGDLGTQSCQLCPV